MKTQVFPFHLCALHPAHRDAGRRRLTALMPCLTTIVVACLVAACTSCRREAEQQPAEVIASTSEGVVQTQQGLVAGFIQNGIYIYKGIPYAKAERFMPPQEPDRWEGIRSSRAFGPTCPQTVRTGWQSDEQAFAFHWDDGYPGEDCLRLNIWTTGLNGGKRRPVMVWLHGGGFSQGSGQELPSYDGANLARRGDVVVVTLNHRLNVLGFLDLSAYGEKYKHSGNVGLLDLIAALQWVNKNIANFGGDPGNVTIFGQSGGGGKVCALLATPAARGLFHKAIVESGPMLRTMDAKYSRRVGVATLEELGLKASQIDQLASLPYDQLLAAGSAALAKVRPEAMADGQNPFIFGWAPVVDGDVLPTQPFDPAAPEISRDIPLIIGTTRHEFTLSAYIPQLRNPSDEVVNAFLQQTYGDRASEFRTAYAEAYPGHKAVDLVDMDRIFRPNSVTLANRKAAQGGAKVWMYLFTWESPVLDGLFRSTHCMEIPFVFDNATLHYGMTGGGADATQLAAKMSQAWVNFAHTGDPNGRSEQTTTADDGMPEWPAYTEEEGATMFFDNRCEVHYHHDRALLEALKSFPAPSF